MSDSTHASLPPSGGAGLNQRLVSSLEALSWASSCLIEVVGLAVLIGWHFDIELTKWLPMRVQLSGSRAVLDENISYKPRRGLKQLLCSDREVIPAPSVGDDFRTVGEEKPK